MKKGSFGEKAVLVACLSLIIGGLMYIVHAVIALVAGEANAEVVGGIIPAAAVTALGGMFYWFGFVWLPAYEKLTGRDKDEERK